MPIRTASLTRQIKKTGAKLHLAMQNRIHSQGAEHPPSEQEQALSEERRVLKEANAQRQAAAKLPKPKLVKAAVAKPAKKAKAPKPPKAAKEPKDAKTAKGSKPSRADKMTKKAENAEAAKKAEKKSAKT